MKIDWKCGEQCTEDPTDRHPAATDPVERVSDAGKTVVAYDPPEDLRTMVGANERFTALDFEPKLASDISPLLFVQRHLGLEGWRVVASGSSHRNVCRYR